MIYKIGRFLQFVGLVLLPIGMAGNLADRLSVGQMLTICGAGVASFFLGWILQQSTTPK